MNKISSYIVKNVINFVKIRGHIIAKYISKLIVFNCFLKLQKYVPLLLT